MRTMLFGMPKDRNDDELARAICGLACAIERLAGKLHEENPSAILHKLGQIERLIMTQNELTAALDAKTTQLVKVAKEQSDRFDVLTAKVQELTDIINNGPGDVSPAVETALAGVTAALDSLDAAIPDAPTPPVA